MNGNIWTATIVVVVLTVGAVAIPATIGGQTTTEQAINETQTLDTENATFLDAKQNMSALYQNETVTSPSGTTTYERGTDYVIDYDSAAIYANDSTLEGQTVEINYSYDRITDDRTSRIATLFAPFNIVLGALAVLALFGTLFGLMGWV